MPADLSTISQLTKNRLSLITNKFTIYKTLSKMLHGSRVMDGLNGIEAGNGKNVMKASHGGTNSNKDVNVLFGVAHTQNQASDLAKALIEGIISL